MREVQVRNWQRDQRLETRVLKRIARALLEEELSLRNYELAIHFVSAKKMSELNCEFLGHEGSTDVITFDYREGYANEPTTEKALDLAGEIFISVSDAKKQALEFYTNWQAEVVRYVVHGVLHLRGYDDLNAAKRKVMKREENRLTHRLANRFDLHKVAG